MTTTPTPVRYGDPAPGSDVPTPTAYDTPDPYDTAPTTWSGIPVGRRHRHQEFAVFDTVRGTRGVRQVTDWTTDHGAAERACADRRRVRTVLGGGCRVMSHWTY
ncbi:hypothetical protein [Corynebacterium variabile]|uniref:hypothetical protein n=1 Tax=Corynebacterium variabile TaxID=1727 RepID=UPI003FD36323